MLRYTVLRLLVLFGCIALLWLLGLRDEDELPWLLLGAALLSAVISYVALRRFREDYSAEVAERIEQRRRARQERTPRTGVDEANEDAEVSRASGDDDYR